MTLEIRHLRLMAAIADEGGVTRAANRLHLTQSALSHQLREVEEKLGTQLFQRLRKGMVLTAAGQRLLRTSRGVLEELQRAEDDIRKTAAGYEGVLRISTECYTNYHWLPSRLKLFHRKYPRVDVQVVVGATAHPLQAILDGRLDLAIVSRLTRDRRLLYKPLFSAEMLVVMHPRHRLATQSWVSVEDLSRETLIVYTTLEDTETYRQLLRPAGVMPKRVLQVQLTEAVLEMVKAGLGISVLARWAVAPQIASGAICALPLTRKGLHRPWSAAMLRTKAPPPHLQEFVQLLAEEPTLTQRKNRLQLSVVS